MKKNDELQWVSADCFGVSGGAGDCTSCDRILECVSTHVDTPLVSCEYCGFLDTDLFDFLNPIAGNYMIATTTQDGTIVTGPFNFSNSGTYLTALNSLKAIQIGNNIQGK